MNKTNLGWLYELEEIFHPKTYELNKEIWLNSENYITELSKKIKSFRPYFTEILSQSRYQAIPILMQIINTSDTLHKFLIESIGIQKSNPFYNHLIQIYRQILNLLESLLDSFGRLDRKIRFTLPITSFSVANIRLDLRMRLDLLNKCIIHSNIDEELGKLLLSGLRHLISRKGISKGDVEYVGLILDRLEKLKPFSTFEIENLLFQHDFNTLTFFNYFAKSCNRFLEDTPNLHTQLEIIIKMEDRINGLPPIGTSKWMNTDSSIRDQIRTFIKEKKLFINQRIELKRAEINDNLLINGADRVQINLSVAQLGLFIRMFMEKDLLPKEDIGKTFAHYARYFCTPNTPFISPESLQKKSTNVEFSTANKIKGHLIGMINWLNEHHNTQRGQN
ncbi:hypothetical protein SMI01S_16660 [Sphingobacterium mizutaii NBRC 14946 = DSM 11724]|uniref:Uncharacterized protein n=2 Tax=Sphingobacterium mizutaii TaxID=1010 RepID=A0AAJ4X8R2_9SPHI|nr:hypothetical protein [Sphingobacterium mizutaii]GEM68060.1 hypothetical protein SMI01S_16660 [Sphingobacterium mizutaii NBRC 14946 = DSM 11724]SDL77344.1 hypothetical protein SAMN05192578_10914 [Sphingobacterium mizutaii]SNV38227.1 Uncharacterised protein [Sphingobacterium mizutaii]